MTLPIRDKVTGMRHGAIRYPDGEFPSPSGCRWCGAREVNHGRRYVLSKGVHAWEMPTNAQVKARVWARLRMRCRV